VKSNPNKSKAYLLVVVIFVVVVVISVISRSGAEDQTGSEGDSADSRACIDVGGTGTVYPGSLSCCEGLTALNCDEHDLEDVCTRGCMESFTCADCGNGECDGGENECNCPGDCDESEESGGMSLVEAKSIAKYGSECGSNKYFIGIDADKISFNEEDNKWHVGLKLSDTGCSGVCLVDPVKKSGVIKLDCS